MSNEGRQADQGSSVFAAYSSTPRAAERDALLREARAGSAEALGRLLVLLRERLAADVARRRDLRGLSPSRGASDLVQDTIVQVHSRFHTLQCDSFALLERWAKRTLSNFGRESQRKRLRRNRQNHWHAIWQKMRLRCDDHADDEALLEHLSPTEKREAQQRIEECLRSLRPDEQAILAAKIIGGCTFVEIARMFAVSPDAARKRYARALERLSARFLANE